MTPDRPKTKPLPTTSYTDEEVQALTRMASPRDKALIFLYAHGGLRIEEALGLKWKDVDLPGVVLTVPPAA